MNNNILQLYSTNGELVLTERPYIKRITAYYKPRKDINTKNKDTINYNNRTKNVTINYMGYPVDYNQLPSTLESKLLPLKTNKNTTKNTTITTTSSNIDDTFNDETTQNNENLTIKQKKYGRANALERLIELQLLWEESEKKKGIIHTLSDLRIGMPSSYIEGSQDNLSSVILNKSPQDSLLHMSSVLKNMQHQMPINTPQPPIFYVNEEDKQLMDQSINIKSTVDNDIDKDLYSISNPDSSRILTSGAIKTAEVLSSSQVLRLKKIKQNKFNQMIRKMNNDTDDDISNVIAGGALLETESIAYSLPESSDANNDNIGFESDSVYESGINFDSESSFKLLPIDKSVFIEPITLKTKRLKSPADNNSNKYNDINDDDSSVDPLSSSTKRSNKNAKKKILCSKCTIVGELWCAICSRAFCLQCWGTLSHHNKADGYKAIGKKLAAKEKKMQTSLSAPLLKITTSKNESLFIRQQSPPSRPLSRLQSPPRSPLNDQINFDDAIYDECTLREKHVLNRKELENQMTEVT